MEPTQKARTGAPWPKEAEANSKPNEGCKEKCHRV